MLQRLSEHISACRDRSTEARQRANEATDPSMKAAFLQMEQRWLQLAQTYEFVQGVEAFLLDSQKAKAGVAPQQETSRAETPIDLNKLSQECVRLAESTGPLNDNDKALLLEVATHFVSGRIRLSEEQRG